MKCLALYLKSPLQCWGVGAKFDARPTMSFPSRSGIVGMLAAAAGVARDDDAWLAAVNRLQYSVCVLAGDEKSGQRLVDYHTVGGGRDEVRREEDDPWRYRMAVGKADGGIKTQVTSREYLQDAAFGIVVSADGDDGKIVESLAEAVQNPVWGMWLGRKSCVPTEPVYAGLYDDDGQARAALAARGARYGEARRRQIVLQVNEVLPVGAEEIIADVPISFARREFASRGIVEDPVD